jgi:hypothetical protein
MSTTFGVYKGDGEIELEDDILPSNFFEDEDMLDEVFIKVAYRGNQKGYNYWKNDLAQFLNDDIKIYPLDNSSQGIYTIGDFRKLLNEKD